MKRSDDLGQSWDEAMIKIDTAKESLDLHLDRRAGHLPGSIHLGLKGHYPGCRDSVSQERDRLEAKSTFLSIY